MVSSETIPKYLKPLHKINTNFLHPAILLTNLDSGYCIGLVNTVSSDVGTGMKTVVPDLFSL